MKIFWVKKVLVLLHAAVRFITGLVMRNVSTEVLFPGSQLPSNVRPPGLDVGPEDDLQTHL